MSIRNTRILATFLLAAATSIIAGSASAQSCAAPVTLSPNVPQWIDTCSGDPMIGVACGMALGGSPGIARVSLAYPVGRVVVQSMAVSYDPALFLLRGSCTNAAFCAAAVDSGVASDTLELGQLDSGDHFLVIAPVDPFSTPCGLVNVTHVLTAQEQALAADGILRAGNGAQAVLD